MTAFCEKYIPALAKLPSALGGMAALERARVESGGVATQFRALSKVLNKLLIREIGSDAITDTSSIVISEVIVKIFFLIILLF